MSCLASNGDDDNIPGKYTLNIQYIILQKVNALTIPTFMHYNSIACIRNHISSHGYRDHTYFTSDCNHHSDGDWITSKKKEKDCLGYSK